MKRLLVLTLLVLLAGAGTYGLTRWLARPAPPADSLDWMTREFSLTPAQREAIAGLQADYNTVCMRHCAEIARARHALATASPADKPAAAAELTRLEAVCTASTRAHLCAVAAQMDPEDGRRFLALVEPKLAAFRHQAPLGLP